MRIDGRGRALSPGAERASQRPDNRQPGDAEPDPVDPIRRPKIEPTENGHRRGDKPVALGQYLPQTVAAIAAGDGDEGRGGRPVAV
ncbi:MAG: hypothetical protein DCC51_14400 [Anaerolineae bacterium]|nr:MAG: hypothetical protein DCC51_14400 [Anaerolineae bacterium]